jgi:carbon monoxide dehydrogenase subunit G
MHLSFLTSKSIDTVFDYLTDMQKFLSVHPLIHRIDPLGPSHYKVHETLRLGFVPFSFSYPATLESNWAKKEVVIRAKVFQLTKIEMRFGLKEEGGQTRIEEVVRFTSPLPVQGIMRKVFKEQHEQLFKNLEALA